MHKSLATESWYQSIVDNASSGFILLDASSRICYANRRFLTWVGAAPDVVVGSPLERWLHPDDQHGGVAPRVDERGAAEPLERRLCSTSGNFTWVRLSYSALHAGDESSPVFSVQIDDIAEARQLHFEVGERRKELAAMYALSRRLIDVRGESESAWLHDVVDLIPPSFRWPEMTESALSIGALTITSAGYPDRVLPSSPRIRAEWDNEAGERCAIEAVYTGPSTDEPFLPEEYPLIETIADLLRLALGGLHNSAARAR